MLEQMFMTLMEGAVCVGTPFILHLCKNMFSSWVIELDLSFWRSATVNKLSQENTAKSMIKTDQEFRTNLFNCLELQRKNSFSAIRFQSYCHLLSTHTSSIAEQMWCDQSYLSVAKLENSTHSSLESVGISPPAYICTSPYSELKDLYPHFKTASSFSAVAEANLQCDLSNISHNLRKDTSGYLTSSDTGPEVDSKVPSCDQTQCGVNELDMSITDCVYNQDGQLVQMFICFDIEHSDTSSAVSSSDSGCKNWDSDCEDFIVFESSCTDEGHCCARFDFVCSETKPEITKRSGDHKESFMKSVVLSSNLYCEVTVRESFDDKLDIFVQEMLQPNLCYSCEEFILNKKCTKEAETNKSGDSTVKTASQDKRKKKVCFKPDHELVVVHPMIVWSFAYRQARKGTWEVDALDRHRFQKRIEEVDKILTPVLLAKIEEVNLSII